MSDTAKIVWGALGAVGVYIIGQLLSKFFIDPLQEICKVIGEIRFTLSFHAATVHTPIGRTDERSTAAQQALLKGSSDLFAKLHAVPAYGVKRLLLADRLPSRASVEQAAIQLRGLSTHMHETGSKAIESLDQIRARVERIERLLKLKPLS